MLTWILILCGVAFAAPEGRTQGAHTALEPQQPLSFADALELAKKHYFAGERERAKNELSDLQVRLLMGEEVPWDRSAEAVVYLGEIFLLDGESGKAREIFRWVLDRDPEYLLSPYAHPIEVVGEFGLVREQVQREIANQPIPPPFRPEPAPAWTALPLGIPQFAAQRPVQGILYGGTQLGLAATSAGLFLSIDRLNTNAKPHPLGLSPDQMAARANLQRFGVQWPVTMAFYGVWIASWVDARGHWREDQKVQAELIWIPRSDAPGSFGVAGRF
ncbi:MAG: hypothetical protein GWP91_10775 [Rhodobacterales bacterium]|nr:hypothetical protein [Rhodobacterales bacterium]